MICLVSVISGLFISLLPKSKLDYAFKGLVSVVVIYCFITPFKSETADVSRLIAGKADKNSDIFVDSSDVIVDCAENLLKQQLDAEIAVINSDAYCEVYIAYKEESTGIDKIEIFGCSDEIEKDSISALIRERTGGDTVIEYR